MLQLQQSYTEFSLKSPSFQGGNPHRQSIALKLCNIPERSCPWDQRISTWVEADVVF